MVKYLKIFERFNNLKVDDIKSCFLDLEDAGFKIQVLMPSGCIFINKDLGTHGVRPFKWIDVKETILFAIPYMASEFDMIVDKILILNQSTSGSKNNLKAKWTPERWEIRGSEYLMGEDQKLDKFFNYLQLNNCEMYFIEIYYEINN